MGRPKLPRDEVRKILIGAKFSPPEARSVEQSARESKLDKSKWIRERLLEHAKSLPSGASGAIEYLADAAALDKAGRVAAAGAAILYHASGTGEFFLGRHFPTAKDAPARAFTRLRTSNGRLYKLNAVEGVCQEGNKPPHLHFKFAPMQPES
jgi:hypothetical protein